MFPEANSFHLLLVIFNYLDTNRPYDELRESYNQFHNLLETDEVPWSHFSTTQLIAEGVYTVKPIVHCILCYDTSYITVTPNYNIGLSQGPLSPGANQNLGAYQEFISVSARNLKVPV